MRVLICGVIRLRWDGLSKLRHYRFSSRYLICRSNRELLRAYSGEPGLLIDLSTTSNSFQGGNLLSYLDLSGARGQVGLLTSCKAPGSTINPGERVDRQGEGKRGRKTSNVSAIHCYWRITSALTDRSSCAGGVCVGSGCTGKGVQPRTYPLGPARRGRGYIYMKVRDVLVLGLLTAAHFFQTGLAC